jgi:hypothetical protein
MQRRDKQAEAEPHVGIFWLYNSTVVTDSAALSEAEPFGEEMDNSNWNDGESNKAPAVAILIPHILRRAPFFFAVSS